jgi:hypothetical protein
MPEEPSRWPTAGPFLRWIVSWIDKGTQYRHFDSHVAASDFKVQKKKEGLRAFGPACQAPRDFKWFLEHLAKGETPSTCFYAPGAYRPKPKPTDRAGATRGFQDAAGWDP